MSRGAGDEYWEERMLPSTLKHALLQRYLPKFMGKTGSVTKSVVYLDGYAGRGRYENGSPASAELTLRMAEDQAGLGITWKLFFHEPDKDSYAALRSVVDEYRARGIEAQADPSEVIYGLDDVVRSAVDLPLFLFLDPCGVGVPFSVLADVLTGPRKAEWPPTEVLLNFSMEAVRRIGGLVRAGEQYEQSMRRLDDALGGQWWREHMRGGVTDEAAESIVDGFIDRLVQATGMDIFAIPVLRGPGQKPLYYLVLGTRHPLGVWYFGDCAARATETWWEELDRREDAKETASGQDSLFGDGTLFKRGRRLDDVEKEARAVIAENIARLAAERGMFRVGDNPVEIFGDYLGRVRETVVRAAIKDLHAAGRTPSDGIGRRIADLYVSPP
jgi:three-Cys-motif partner protein